MSGGTITRKDLITDEGLEFGKEYAKNIQLAIEANNELVDSAKVLAQVANSYQKANNSQAFITAKNEEKLALQRVENAIKAEELALKSAEKIKQESLRTKKLELDAIGKEEAAKKRTTALTIEERVQNEINNRALKQSVLAKLNLTEAYTKLNKSRTDAKNKLRELIITEGESSKATAKAREEFNKLDSQVKRADTAVNDFTKNVGNYPKLNAFAGGLKNLVGAFGLVGGITAFASVVKGAITIVREYDAELVNLAAVAGKSRKEIKPLEDQIRNVAKTSINGATDVAKLASELIKLGSSEEEVMALLKPIDDLSVALRTTAEDAAGLVKGLLNAYGEGADQAARYTDVLAAAANKTSLDFNGLRDSLSYLAPVAKSLNLSLEETTSIIGILADNNIKAESAGRLMATSFTRLATNGMTLNQALDQVNKKQAEGADNLEVLALAGKLFGAESAKLALILANNRDKMAGLNEEFKNSRGSLEELTNKQLQSLDARLKQVDSSWEDFILSIEDGQGPIGAFITDWLNGFSLMLESLTRLNTSWDELNEKAEQAGKANGLKQFQQSINDYKKVGTTEADALSVTLKQAQLELSKFQGELDKANGKLKEYEGQNFFAGVFGGGYDMEQFYNEEKERLTAAVAQRKAIIDQANEKLNGSTKEVTEETEKQITSLTDEEIKKRKDLQDKAMSDYLSKLKKQEDDIYALQKFRLDRGAELNDEITADENQSIQDRIDAYLESEQLKLSSLNLTLEHELVSNALSLIDAKNTSIEKMKSIENEAKLKAKQLSDGVVLSENASNTEKLIYEKYLRDKEILSKKEIQDKQKIIDSIVEIENSKFAKIAQDKDTELNKELLRQNQDFQDTLDALKGNQLAIEDATKEHEARVLAIKKEAISKGLTAEINATKTLLKNADLSTDVKSGLLNKLSKLELELNQVSVNDSIETNDSKLDLEKEYSERVKELRSELASVLTDFASTLFDNRIAKIDAELQANEEYYARQIELAGNDEAQKTLLEQEREKKREALEKKKKKAEFQAALFNKIVTLATIASQTAMASVAALAPPPIGLGPVLGPSLLPYIITTGAIQAAIVAATPLPKYEKGTQGKPHKGGFAEVGEKRAEVILEPGRNPYVVEKPSILNLPKGTEVIPSLNEWERMQRASIMASLDMEANKAKNYQGSNAFDARYDAELLEELRRNTEATKKNKSNVIVQNNIDLGHEIWKLSNIKWGS